MGIRQMISCVQEKSQAASEDVPVRAAIATEMALRRTESPNVRVPLKPRHGLSICAFVLAD